MGWSWSTNESTEQDTVSPTVPSTVEEQDVSKKKSSWSWDVEPVSPTDASEEIEAPQPLATDELIEEYSIIAAEQEAEIDEEDLPQVLATDLIDFEDMRFISDDIYGNIDNPDMYYTELDIERFARDDAPFLQQAYLDMAKEELKADPKSPYWKNEVARLERQGFAIPEYEDDPNTPIDESDLFDRIENNLPINDNKFPPIFVEKYVKELNRRNTPETIAEVRKTSEIQYQEYKNTLEPRALEQAKEAGFDDIDSWISSLPEDRQEMWNSQPRTRQEFFDRAIEKSDENIRGSMMVAYSLLNAENPVTRHAAELIMMSDDFNLT